MKNEETVVIKLSPESKRLIKIEGAIGAIAVKRLLLGLFSIYKNSSEEQKKETLKKIKEGWLRKRKESQNGND